MPVVELHMLRGRSPERRRALLDAVHAALTEAFGIPEKDRIQRLREYEPGDFEYPEGRSGEFTMVEITAFPGRSPAAKRALYQAIVRRFGALGVPGRDVFIVLREPPMENWGLRGGVPASEIDFGFKIDV